VLLWCAGLAVLCAQASSFFSCSFGTTSSIPILPPPPVATPSVTITVKPTTIVLGESAVLTWSSIGVNACTASGAWSGPQSVQGSTKVTPPTTGNFAYVLNCSVAPSGSIAQSATLTVDAMAASASAHHVTLGRREARVRRTDLLADVTGSGALGTDPYLVEPWGLVLPEEELPAVVASRRSDTSAFYGLQGSAQRGSAPPMLHLPGRTRGLPFGVSGVVENSSDGFIVSVAGRAAPARVIYAGTAGMLAAWSRETDLRAVTVFAADDSASYTGLALATSSTPSERHLYAADFRHGRIDVFDTDFSKLTATATKSSFIDPALPPGYAPFGIAVIDDLVYVAYAQRPPSSGADPVTGAGLGLVGVFTPGGDFITRLIGAGGALNAPWGMVRAPADGEFPFAGALLVGNTGDGTIQAFDVRTGTLLGSLVEESGVTLVIPNLHGLAFGNGDASQSRATLFFSAGEHAGAQGWYGRLDAAAPGEAPAR
jgi:uncharacterized protein (TIGR03118 family)